MAEKTDKTPVKAKQVQVLNDCARMISFPITRVFAKGNEPPTIERIVFRPNEMTSVAQEDLDKLDSIPLFDACVKSGELVVMDDKHLVRQRVPRKMGNPRLQERERKQIEANIKDVKDMLG